MLLYQSSMAFSCLPTLAFTLFRMQNASPNSSCMPVNQMLSQLGTPAMHGRRSNLPLHQHCSFFGTQMMHDHINVKSNRRRMLQLMKSP